MVAGPEFGRRNVSQRLQQTSIGEAVNQSEVGTSSSCRCFCGFQPKNTVEHSDARLRPEVLGNVHDSINCALGCGRPFRCVCRIEKFLVPYTRCRKRDGAVRAPLSPRPRMRFFPIAGPAEVPSRPICFQTFRTLKTRKPPRYRGPCASMRPAASPPHRIRDRGTAEVRTRHKSSQN